MNERSSYHFAGREINSKKVPIYKDINVQKIRYIVKILRKITIIFVYNIVKSLIKGGYVVWRLSRS